MKIFYFLIIMMIASGAANAQKEFNNWYFGNYAGITFNTPDREPIALDDGKLITTEGCSSISDRDGNLLFYTDGITVWNRNHQFMKNGEGLLGHSSSSQSALIVKKPDSDNIYYIFTAGVFSGTAGINYSIVNMSYENGNGRLEEKNIPLLKTISEKITGVVHSNGSDIWVMCQDTKQQNFSAFLVTNKGVETKPVISPFTSSINSHPIGMMKFSRNTKKLVVSQILLKNGFLLYDFDNSTGIVSNEIFFALPNKDTYGAEFSGNSKYLYITNMEKLDTKKFIKIYQFDVSSNDSATIINSIYTIVENVEFNNGALQIGPNHKIYSTFNKYLAVINKPDLKCPDCDFVSESIFLNNRSASLGLPSEVQGYRNNGKITLCAGNNLTLYIKNFINGSVIWTGPIDFYSEESEPLIKSVIPEMSGYYYYSIYEDNKLVEYDSILVNVKPLEKILFKDTSEITVNTKTLNLKAVDNPENTKIKWYGIDSEENEVIITKSGRYSVVTENESGCSDSASVIVRFFPKYCNGDNAILDFFYEEPENPKTRFEYLWSGPNNFTSTDKNPVLVTANEGMSGDYNVRIIAITGSGDFLGELDTTYLTVPLFIHPKLDLELTADKIRLCDNESTEIKANNNFYEYLWSTGETTPFITVKDAGIYQLIVKNEFGCADTAEIEIFKYSPKISSNLDKLTFDELCVGESQSRTLNLTLSEGEEFIISEIMSNSSNYKIIVNKKIIKFGEPAEVIINFNPKEAGLFEDELIIRSVYPCIYEKIIPITSSSNQIIKFTMPEISAIAGEYIEIPINAEIICPSPESLNTNYELTITVDKEYFNPDKVQYGVINSNQIIGNERVISISSNGDFNQNDSEINKIFGYALVSREERVPIEAKNARFTNSQYRSEVENGSILVDGCVNNLSRLKMFTPTTLKITPNPSDSEIMINIGTQENGKFLLVIYDIDGKEIFKSEFIKPDKVFEIKQIQMGTNELRNGIYSVHLSSPWSQIVEKVIISR